MTSGRFRRAAAVVLLALVVLAMVITVVVGVLRGHTDDMPCGCSIAPTSGYASSSLR